MTQARLSTRNKYLLGPISFVRAPCSSFRRRRSLEVQDTADSDLSRATMRYSVINIRSETNAMPALNATRDDAQGHDCISESDDR